MIKEPIINWSEQLDFQISALYNRFAQTSKPNLYKLTDQVHAVCAQIFYENHDKINLELFIKKTRIIVKNQNEITQNVHVHFSEQFVTEKIQEIAQTVSIKPQSLDDLMQAFEEIHNILLKNEQEFAKKTSYEARKYFIKYIQDVITEFEKCDSSQTIDFNIKNNSQNILKLQKTINQISKILQAEITLEMKMNTQTDLLTSCLYEIISKSYELKNIPLLDNQLLENIKIWIKNTQEEDLSEFETWISKNLSKNLLPEPYKQLKTSINHIYKKFKEQR